jgi:hypothetical protein
MDAAKTFTFSPSLDRPSIIGSHQPGLTEVRLPTLTLKTVGRLYVYRVLTSPSTPGKQSVFLSATKCQRIMFSVLRRGTLDISVSRWLPTYPRQQERYEDHLSMHFILPGGTERSHKHEQRPIC